MRFYEIALFIFIFNLVLGLITDMNITQVGVHKIESGWGEADIIQAESTMSNVVSKQQGILGDLNWLVENVKLVGFGIIIILKALANATIFFPVMLVTLGVPTSAIAVLSAIVYFIYVMGIVQFIVGKSFKEVQ